MEFLVRITVDWPQDMTREDQQSLVKAEAARARELREAGTIRRLWRIPGRWSNVGIWAATDATELHESITSLPLSRWLRVEVEPLAQHPSDPGPGSGHTGEERS